MLDEFLHGPKAPPGPLPPGTTRTYGTQKQSFRVIGVGIAIYAAPFFARHVSGTVDLGGARLAIVIALLGLLAAIPVGVLVMSRNYGVAVSDAGVSDRAAPGASETPWDEVHDFLVKPMLMLGMPCITVWLVRRDGSEVPLRSLSNWGWRGKIVARYREALCQELELQRATRRHASVADRM